MKDFNISAFGKFDRQWALVTAGSAADHNTMTISWGGLGTLWNKPVATVYVRPSRHTFGFMEREEYFTVSFYAPEYRPDLALLGEKSGRDGDKVALTRLTPRPLEHGVTFAQAQATLVCRKLYAQDLDPAAMPKQVLGSCYRGGDIHRMYIGEVVDIIE